ncbi:hypothetical protein D9M69_513090 [compost metagenome]
MRRLHSNRFGADPDGHSQGLQQGLVTDRDRRGREASAVSQRWLLVVFDLACLDLRRRGIGGALDEDQLLVIGHRVDFLRQHQRPRLVAVAQRATAVLAPVERLVHHANRRIAQALAVLLGQLRIAGCVDHLDMECLHDAVGRFPAVAAVSTKLVLVLEDHQEAQARPPSERRRCLHLFHAAQHGKFVDQEQQLVFQAQRAIRAMAAILR